MKTIMLLHLISKGNFDFVSFVFSPSGFRFLIGCLKEKELRLEVDFYLISDKVGGEKYNSVKCWEFKYFPTILYKK